VPLRTAPVTATLPCDAPSSLFPKQNQPHVSDKVGDQTSKRRHLILPQVIKAPAHPDKPFARSGDVIVAALEFEHVRVLALGDGDFYVEIHSVVLRFCYASLLRARLWPHGLTRFGARDKIFAEFAGLGLPSDFHDYQRKENA
jgi:hypothetical protein